jgi:hypothetical protein
MALRSWISKVSEPLGDEIGEPRAGVRIVVAHADPHAGQQPVGDATRRLVGAIGDQHLVAAAEHGEQRQRDGGEAGGREHRAGRAFEVGDAFLDRG